MPDSTVLQETAGFVSQERLLKALSRLRDLPASAPVVHHALAQIESADFVVADLKKTLVSDQAVAARILRLANSAYFGFRSQVQTISQAVVLLGQERIRTLLQRILADRLWLELSRGRASAASLRRMSLATATGSCTLSQLLLREDAEQMLLAGLLHNVGELFFLSQFPAEYQRVCQLAQTQSHGEALTAVFGMTAGRAGRLLLGGWNFSPVYPIVVEHCGDPLSADVPVDSIFAVALVHAGMKLAEAFVTGGDAGDAISRISPEIAETFHLEPGLLAEAYETLPERMSLDQLQAERYGASQIGYKWARTASVT